MAKVNTSATGSAPTSDAPATKGKKYETMIIGVSKARKASHTALLALGSKLHCKTSDLVWEAIDAMIANPPKAAPANATATVGSAAGFWVIPVTDPKSGRAKSVKVVEVESRGQTTGQTFFRYKVGDDKGRARAETQALRAAEYTGKLAGFSTDGLASEKYSA